MRLEFLELDWLRRVKNTPPKEWFQHDCPNAIVVVYGDKAVKFNGSISKLVIVCMTLVICAALALLGFMVTYLAELHCLICIGVSIFSYKLVSIKSQAQQKSEPENVNRSANVSGDEISRGIETLWMLESNNDLS